MNIMYQEHISTLKALASGIDPITGEPYEPSSTLQSAAGDPCFVLCPGANIERRA